MEIYKFLDKEFQIIILKQFSEMQENTDKQLNKIFKKCINKMRSLIKT